ncbi:MAG: hypothetical protein F4Y26_08570 [Gammaproteobacteria bacterium]|nr:hypothetical protein [Gammaproteobacteria bacterium]
MNEAASGQSTRLRLQRLAKGALFVGIAAGYTLLLALALVLHGWKPALLALFFVIVGQFFRHIASEADRIGWRLDAERNEASPEAQADADTRSYQRRMLWLFASLAQLPNVALVAQATLLADPESGAVTAVSLLVIEALYLTVRRLNRRTAFREASYGFKDRGPFSDGASPIDASRERREAEVERKLAELRKLAEDGRISRRAYEKARDRHRVRVVMVKDAS